MASLDSLPSDQKAVLSLVLQRGQSFDQIAALLFIDRASVRRRALEGLDALGPETSIDPLRRGLIADYLLGQLPPAVASSVYASLASNPSERAWARVIAAEIAPLATNPPPEIPAAGAAPVPEPVDRDPADRYGDNAQLGPAAVVSPAGAKGAAGASDAPIPASYPPVGERARNRRTTSASIPASSRRGGAILLGLILAIVIVVVVVLLLTGGSSKQPRSQTSAEGTTSPTSTVASASASSTTVTPVYQINLSSPTSTKGREGAADVVRADGKLGLVLVAEGLAANTKNAYGVWLYNSKTGAADFLGFYNDQVTSTGKTKGALTAEKLLPADATQYNELLLTLETAESPTKPGTIVLQGTFAE
jgi:hypothetical protein